MGDELDTVFGADVNETVNKIALGGPQKIVRVFQISSGEVLFELKKHTDWIYCVDYSPDGVLVASGDRSGGLHVWEADTGRLYLDLIGHKGSRSRCQLAGRFECFGQCQRGRHRQDLGDECR